MEYFDNLEGVSKKSEEIKENVSESKDLHEAFWERMNELDEGTSENAKEEKEEKKHAEIAFGSSLDANYYKEELEKAERDFKHHQEQYLSCQRDDSGLTGYHKGQMEIAKNHIDSAQREVEYAMKKE